MSPRGTSKSRKKLWLPRVCVRDTSWVGATASAISNNTNYSIRLPLIRIKCGFRVPLLRESYRVLTRSYSVSTLTSTLKKTLRSQIKPYLNLRYERVVCKRLSMGTLWFQYTTILTKTSMMTFRGKVAAMWWRTDQPSIQTSHPSHPCLPMSWMSWEHPQPRPSIWHPPKNPNWNTLNSISTVTS